MPTIKHDDAFPRTQREHLDNLGILPVPAPASEPLVPALIRWHDADGAHEQRVMVAPVTEDSVGPGIDMTPYKGATRMESIPLTDEPDLDKTGTPCDVPDCGVARLAGTTRCREHHDTRIGKTCGACGWIVREVDGKVALCMHDVTFLGPPPAIWVPLTEPIEARMLRFEHDGTVSDLGSVTVEPVVGEPIELAPYQGTVETWAHELRIGGLMVPPRSITPEEMRDAVQRFEAQPHDEGASMAAFIRDDALLSDVNGLEVDEDLRSAGFPDEVA